MFLINPYIYGAPIDYLVDDYSPVVAYSVNKISSTITNVIRLRRSSDNAESDFSASDLTDGTATTWTGANDGLVVKWYNQGTGGATEDIAQASASLQPKVISLGTYLGFISFFTGKYLTKGGAVSALSSEPLSYFVTTEQTATNVSGVINTGSGASGGSRLQVYPGRAPTPYGFLIKNTTANVYSCSPIAILSSANHLQTGIIDSSKNMELWVDSTTQSTDTFTGTYVNDVFEVGTMSFYNQGYSGRIRELIIFGTDETANRTDIETNINDRYLIY